MQRETPHSVRFRCLQSVVIGMMMCGVWMSCKTNPFAPRLDTGDRESSVLGDQRTLDGVFRSFEYAYTTKDTLIYGRLIAPNFTFRYIDYDNGAIERNWARDTEMFTTFGLFRNTEVVNLKWNSIITQDVDSLQLQATVSRTFQLQVQFGTDATNTVVVSGIAELRLARPTQTDVWLISDWIDRSNF